MVSLAGKQILGYMYEGVKVMAQALLTDEVLPHSTHNAASDIEPDDEEKEITPFIYSVSSYGADYDVEGLVRRLRQEDIIVPDFQRQFVWDIEQSSRFIESLLFGLPVPAIFLAVEEETRQLLVIDGQQRLRTIQYFYNGKFGDKANSPEFHLQGIGPRFAGATYASLASEDRRRLDNSIIHAIIVKQDKPSDDSSSIYYIFERLNIGGIKLQPQEIRTAIYRGEFNELLKELSHNKTWRAIYNSSSTHLKDQEFILRFFAFYYNAHNYKEPMKAFLNDYMGANRHLRQQSEAQLRALFEQTISAVQNCLTAGMKPFRPQNRLNVAVFDAVMVGIARRLERGPITACEEMRHSYQELTRDTPDNDFIAVSKASTANREAVMRRIELASRAFANIQ